MTGRLFSAATFILLVTPTIAQEAATPIEVWRSSYGDEDRIALEAEALLTRLQASSSLAYEPVLDLTGKSVETLMREEGRFVGAYYPAAVDRMVCEANPTRCTVAGDGTTVWTNRKFDMLNLPAITFERLITPGSAWKPLGTTVDEIWSVSGDCKIYGLACTEAVSALNSNNLIAYDRQAAGEVTVPQLAYRAVITDRTLTEPAIEAWNGGSPLVTVENFVAKGPGGSFFTSVEGEPDYPQQSDLFMTIGFPWPGAESDQISAAIEPKARIGFVDGWLDAGHSEFGGRISVASDGAIADLSSFCGAANAALSELCDHATHVVGIVAAAVDGRGVAGLNPFADITFRPADIHNVQDPAVGERLAEGLFLDAVSGHVDVFNLSWGYPQVPGTDPLGNMITDTLKDRLFVVAAGNSDQHFEHGECGILPACFTDAPNIVSVVGLDRSQDNPMPWHEAQNQGSNWNAEFHVGAIAGNVLSTVSGDRVGVLSGTSQAAPQVTATAAYIISAYREYRGTGAALPPVEVKNRLIYTSDIFPDLLPAMRGGRLNMRRAIDIDMDQIVLGTIRPGEVLRGKLTLLGNFLHDQHVLCRDRLAREFRVTKEDLRRMVRLPDGNYVLFDAPPDGFGREGMVARIGPCALRTKSHAAQFIVEGDGSSPTATLSFTIADIVDFTAGMN